MIRQYPHATEPFLALLRLKVPTEEIELLLPEPTSWCRIYVMAHHDRRYQDYKSMSAVGVSVRSHSNQGNIEAKDGFRTLERYFKNDIDLCYNIAECEMESGHDLQALYALESMRNTDPDNIVGSDKYAALLREQGKATAINQLAQTVFSIADDRPECWLVLSHYAEIKGDKEKALFYVNTVSESARD